MIYIGCDNGVTGSIGIIDSKGIGYQYPIPTKRYLNYQKTKVKYINRIDVDAFRDVLRPFLTLRDANIPLNEESALNRSVGTLEAKCLLERPLCNPQRFDATTSALRALEATLIALEGLGIGVDYVDSKAWQKVLLPYISVQDKRDYPAKLKEVSLQVGMRKYPNVDWTKFKDADGVLIAEYCRMYYGSNNESKTKEDNLLV